MNDIAPLGDLSAEKFLRDYWQKKPLLIRNAFPDFEPPVDADTLAGLACEAMVESRLISQDASGEQWQLQHGPFSEEDLAKLPASHWTLLVQAVDHWVPDANALLERFRFIPSWRIDDLMISYAAQGGGVGPHYDNYDVFLIQASGQRRWEYGGIYGEDSPQRDDTPVMILPEWQAQESFVLNPGDMLYLPPRVGHNGVAESDDCMTYSVGFRAPSHADLLRQFTDHLGEHLKSEIRYSDADLTPQDSPSEIRNEAFDKVRQIMLDYINEPGVLEDWFGQYMTEPKYPENSMPLPESEQLSIAEMEGYLMSGGLVYRNEGVRFAYRIRDDKSIMLFVDGKACEVSARQMSFIKALTDQPAIGIKDASSAEAFETLCALQAADAVYIEE